MKSCASFIEKVVVELSMLAEPSEQEFATQQYLLSHIKQLALPYYLFGTSILVKLPGATTRGRYAYRADMDAITVNGTVTHACGHAVHMAVALSLLYRFAQCDLIEPLWFVFQSGEENATGANLLLPFLLEEEIQAIIGMHVLPGDRYQWVSNRNCFFAGSREFDIVLKGPGGHGAYPYYQVDLMNELGILLLRLQSGIMHYFPNPPLLNIGNIRMNSLRNVLPSEMILEGTFRYQTQQEREIMDWLKQTIRIGEVRYRAGCLPVRNDPYLYDLFTDKKEVPCYWYAEDFGNYLSKLQGMFVGNTCGSGALHREGFHVAKQYLPRLVDDMYAYLNRLLLKQ